MDISVLCSTDEQIRTVLDAGITDEIIAETDSVTVGAMLDIRSAGIKLTAALPRIWRRNSRVEGFESYLIRNVDELELVRGLDKEVISDYTLYTMNDGAAQFLKTQGVSRITAPIELNERELRGMECEQELVIYGYLPMMVSAQCINKNLNGCDKTPAVLMLEDRKNKMLPVRNICSECYNIIYNPEPMSLFGVLDKMERLGVKRARIDFSIESGQECIEVLKKYKDRQDPKSFTRGHFGRGVE